jgi:hypothetical protein
MINNEESVAANNLTIERRKTVRSVIAKSKISARKVLDETRKIATRDRMTLRVER